MSFKRILIEEKEKQDILKLYGVLNEQSNLTTYSLKNDHYFSISGQKLGGSPNTVIVRKGTTIYASKDGKSVTFNVYYKENNKLVQSYDKGKLNCGDNIIYVGNQTYQQAPDTGQPFKTTINKLFCSVSVKGGQEPKKEVVGGSQYSDCGEGPYKKGCKDPNAAYRKPDPNGIIYKLQGCLGIQNPDSFFGTNTEKLLLDKTTKTSITKDEIDRLCSGGGEIGKLPIKRPEELKPSQSNIAPDIDNEERPQ